MEFVSFQIPARNDKIDVASKVLRDLLERHLVDVAIIDECDLALQELLRNIVKYAFGDDEDRRIEIRLGMERRRFFAEVEDDGMLVVAEDAPVMGLEKDEPKIGLYDTTKVKEFMDEVQYQYRDAKKFWVISRML